MIQNYETVLQLAIPCTMNFKKTDEVKFLTIKDDCSNNDHEVIQQVHLMEELKG